MKDAQEIYALAAQAADILQCGASEKEFKEITDIIEAVADLADESKNRGRKTMNTALIAIAATAREALKELDETGTLVRLASERISEALREPEAKEEQDG